MLVALRATHERIDLSLLDRLTQGTDALPEALKAEKDSPLAGFVVISTCNRLEIYLDAEKFHDAHSFVMGAIARMNGLALETVYDCFAPEVGSSAVTHLFEVAAGMRSAVLGEAEVVGQVRNAFNLASAAGHVTPMLHDLFQEALRCAKRVTSQAKVGAAGRSGVSVAIDEAERQLGTLVDRRILVVGTGAYARLGTKDLIQRGVRSIEVFSTSGRAAEFAATHQVRALGTGIESLREGVHRADLVIACSGRGTSLFPFCFLGAGNTVVLDLALHTDVHQLVRHLSDVSVIDLGDLRDLHSDVTSDAVGRAQALIAESVERFISRQASRRLDPAVAALRSSVKDAIDRELESLRQSYPEDVYADVEVKVHRIFSKLMHRPMKRAQELAQAGQADDYLRALSTLFDITVENEDAPRELSDEQVEEAPANAAETAPGANPASKPEERGPRTARVAAPVRFPAAVPVSK
ncbi:glutamyl-tRNA reductase [Dermabacteraceae bacterium P13101]